MRVHYACKNGVTWHRIYTNLHLRSDIYNNNFLRNDRPHGKECNIHLKSLLDKKEKKT